MIGRKSSGMCVMIGKSSIDSSQFSDDQILLLQIYDDQEFMGINMDEEYDKWRQILIFKTQNTVNMRK